MSEITLYVLPDGKPTKYSASDVKIENGVLTFQANTSRSNSYAMQKYTTNMPFLIED